LLIIEADIILHKRIWIIRKKLLPFLGRSRINGVISAENSFAKVFTP